MAANAIDWTIAQHIGELIAGAGGRPGDSGIRAESVESRARDFAERVSDYTGLALPTELPPLEVVDRPAWIAANLKTMRPLLDPLTERIGGGPAGGGLSGLLSVPLRAASGYLLGAQVGALTGVLSQRVLGQYDLALLDASVAPRLLLVAPNLAQAARNLGVDRDELVLWVTIHEVTHAVQFSGAPWLREHLGGILKELIDGLQVTLAGGQGGRGFNPSAGGRGGWAFDLGQRIGGRVSGRGFNPNDLRGLLERARRGELLRLTLGEERWQLVERMQATMSLVEGHAEHTMDAVGSEVLPSLPRLRTAMNRRRETRGLSWRVLERLLGLELKMKQYEVGKRFCDAVVRAEGPRALTRAWSAPEMLPSTAELQAPALWLARTHVPSVTS